MWVEVAFALEDKQLIIPVEVAALCSAEEAILQSNILQEFPQINLLKNKIGIFSEICALNRPLQENDRVEIYRELAINPMEARRLRAIKQKQ